MFHQGRLLFSLLQRLLELHIYDYAKTLEPLGRGDQNLPWFSCPVYIFISYSKLESQMLQDINHCWEDTHGDHTKNHTKTWGWFSCNGKWKNHFTFLFLLFVFRFWLCLLLLLWKGWDFNPNSSFYEIVLLHQIKNQFWCFWKKIYI